MLKNFITRPKIGKYTDNAPSLPKILSGDPALQPSLKQAGSLNKLVEDTILLAQNASLQTQKLINEIENDNPKPITIEYSNFLKLNTWSPLELFDNPKSRPPNLTVAKFTVLERKVFEGGNVRDRFLSELYRSRQLAQTVEYGFQALWSQVDWPDDNPLGRYITGQFQKTVRDILGFTNSVSLFSSGYRPGVVGLIRYYMDDILTGNPDSFKKDLDRTIAQLKTLDSFEEGGRRSLQQNWEKIQADLRTAGGDPFWRSVKNSIISVWTAAAIKNFDLVEEVLENIVSVDFDDVISQSMINSTTERGVAEIFGHVESFLITQHSENSQLFELRSLALHNAIKTVGLGTNGILIGNISQALESVATKPFDDAVDAFERIKRSLQ